MANLFSKYRKQAPAAILRAASAASDELAAAPLVARATSTTLKTSTSTSSKRGTTSSTRKSTSTSTKTTSTTSATLQSASVQATDIANDRAYYVNVTVGSTQMLLNFDTGSSDLWVFSTALPAAQRGSHKLYPLSGTKIAGSSFNVAYQEGSGAAGAVYADKVVVGGVTATIQAVEAATSVSSKFVTGLQDGLVGLGFIEGNTCSPNSCYGFMHQIANNLPKVLFSAVLRHNAPGEYHIGFIDPSKYTGALTYVDVTDLQGMGYWEFIASGYSIGSGAQQTGGIDAIADTGTSLALVDNEVVNAFYAPVTGAVYSDDYAAVIFPCSSTSQLPSLSYYMGGAKHTMPGKYVVYGTLSSPAGYCFGGVQSNDQSGLTILGDVFLKSQYVVFDVCLQRLGFAQQAGVVV